MAGVVNKSFLNDVDGRHWCEVNVWNAEAIAAFEAGWGVSNAYLPLSKAPGGIYHDIKYDEEIMDAQYDHLLITDKPRYAECKVLTPEQYKQYNENLKKELSLIQNKSQGAGKMKNPFEIFKREKVEADLDLSTMDVKLPKTGKTVNMQRILNETDEKYALEEKGDMMANVSHKVAMKNGSICNVGELMEKHEALLEENAHLKNMVGEYEKGMANKEETASDEEKEYKELENEASEEEKTKYKNSSDEEKKAMREELKNRRKNKVSNMSDINARRDAELAAIREKNERIRTAPNRIENQSGMDMRELQPVFVSRQDALARGLKNHGSKPIKN